MAGDDEPVDVRSVPMSVDNDASSVDDADAPDGYSCLDWE